MIFWKSIAIALAVILGLSYAGFAYVYSQARGIGVDAQQPKIVTLLRNQNVTSSWNASVNILGYKTGFLYVNVSALGNLISGINRPFMVSWLFEADEIKGVSHLCFLGISIREMSIFTRLTWQEAKCGSFSRQARTWVRIRCQLFGLSYQCHYT